ncbi:hypothetical protein Csa_002032 [Cucumis sativus]|uniref:Uncharacterized protein n=1 Tax=Cucumis sativus TaxID=3659 RepID=A0A0A0LF89_CUCSA|nr:hypothetical protein Csa_002032 [Cucumis sativus]
MSYLKMKLNQTLLQFASHFAFLRLRRQSFVFVFVFGASPSSSSFVNSSFVFLLHEFTWVRLLHSWVRSPLSVLHSPFVAIRHFPFSVGSFAAKFSGQAILILIVDLLFLFLDRNRG